MSSAASSVVTSACARLAVALLASVFVVVSVATAADAKSSRKRGWHRCNEYCQARRQSASEREWEHTRAKAYDPGGSFDGYPDWARYALSPKSSR